MSTSTSTTISTSISTNSSNNETKNYENIYKIQISETLATELTQVQTQATTKYFNFSTRHQQKMYQKTISNLRVPSGF